MNKQGIRILGIFVLTLILQSLQTVAVLAGEVVCFSDKIKKVLKKKNKVGIKNPEINKRFAVLVIKQTKLNDYGGIKDIQKQDSVTEKYVVMDKGLYVATVLNKK